MPLRDLNNWMSTGIFGLLLSAIFGRLMWLAEKSARGERVWGWRLLLELPVAFGMALIAEGIAEHFSLGKVAALGLVSALAYLGPVGLQETLKQIIKWKGKS